MLLMLPRTAHVYAGTATRCPRAPSVAFVVQAAWRTFDEQVRSHLRAGGRRWLGAYLPDVPGVVALGVSRAVVAKRIREALAAYTDDLREHGGSLPTPHHVAGTVAT